ncbi:hypothetical protein OG943_04340 [Amycolatopsis sp. NBC_00345]|uniref:hypothetical protein n=1 Tax=Amycolatopsis sp. NBC_00345 TaxID=2975955 RepID=UPI002E257418
MASRLTARPHWTLRSIVDRLDDERRRLTELRAGPLAVEAVFEVVHRQFVPPLAHDFVLLASVAGTEFTLREAAAVLGVDEDVAEARLDALIDACLLEETFTRRFRIHELLVLFGRGLQRDQAEETAALDRLLSQLLATARTAFACAASGDPAGDVLGWRRLPDPGPPITDLRSARDWVSRTGHTVLAACARVAELGAAGLLGTAIDLLLAMGLFAAEPGMRRLDAITRTLAEAAADTRAPTGPISGRCRRARFRTAGRAEFLHSTIALRTGTYADVEVHAQRAVTAATVSGDRVILQQALSNRGLAAHQRHDYPFAIRCFDRSAELARRLGHHSGEATSRLNAAHARLRSGAELVLAACEPPLGDDCHLRFAERLPQR